MQLSIIRSTPDSSAEPTTLHLVGSIDFVTQHAFVQAGEEALAAAPDSGIHIDAGGVDFIDSVGVSAFIELDRVARRRGVPFVIVRQSDRLERVLDLVGLKIGADMGLVAQHASA